jgi:hypothetical protein
MVIFLLSGIAGGQEGFGEQTDFVDLFL